MGVQRRPSAKVVNALAPVFALMLLIGIPMPVYADGGPKYAGEQSGSIYADGIDGYIRQSTTLTLPTGKFHFNWIGVCSPTLCGNTWVQTGEVQGNINGYNYPSRSSVYTEMQDACGRWHFFEYGAAPANQAYYVVYDNYSYAETCPAGTPNQFQAVVEYEYAYARGSLGNVYYYGFMAAPEGIFSARTEIQPDQTVTIGQDFFGCSGVATCSNHSYAISYHRASNWIMWTGNGGTFADNPPAYKPYNANWSFETCPNNGCI